MAVHVVYPWPLLGTHPIVRAPGPTRTAVAVCLPPKCCTPCALYTSVCAGHRGMHAARWCLDQGA
eukprot:7096841-Alexandrium_andersonii.AAC.1